MISVFIVFWRESEPDGSYSDQLQSVHSTLKLARDSALIDPDGCFIHEEKIDPKADEKWEPIRYEVRV